MYRGKGIYSHRETGPIQPASRKAGENSEGKDENKRLYADRGMPRCRES